MKSRLITMDDVLYGDVFTAARGRDYAPIGTIDYFDGSTPPIGWLICDGSTKNISNYPDLANYFYNQHGSKNYYGGNGSTTFGVPTKKGMPDGASFESTTEHIIGVDKDNKPIYEKTISCGQMKSNNTKTVAHGISNVSRFIDYGGFAYNSTYAVVMPYAPSGLTAGSPYMAIYLDKTNINFVTGSTYNWEQYSTSYVTIRYTKTTDSAVSAGHSADGKGIWCIKATVSGHIYSTSEQQVGTWIDGNTLFEKTVTTGGSVPSGATEIYRETFTGYDVLGYTKTS